MLDAVMSLESRLRLVDDNQCEVLLVSGQAPVAVEEIRQHRAQCRVIALPSLDNLLGMADVAQYHYSYTFDEVKDDRILILHTSGTTYVPVRNHEIRRRVLTNIEAIRNRSDTLMRRGMPWMYLEISQDVRQESARCMTLTKGREDYILPRINAKAASMGFLTTFSTTSYPFCYLRTPPNPSMPSTSTQSSNGHNQRMVTSHHRYSKRCARTTRR